MDVKYQFRAHSGYAMHYYMTFANATTYNNKITILTLYINF